VPDDTSNVPDARTRHESIHGQEVVVDRLDLGRVAAPNDARGSDRRLLGQGHLFNGASEIRNVGDRDEPFRRRRPEMNCERSSRMGENASKLGVALNKWRREDLCL